MKNYFEINITCILFIGLLLCSSGSYCQFSNSIVEPKYKFEFKYDDVTDHRAIYKNQLLDTSKELNIDSLKKRKWINRKVPIPIINDISLNHGYYLIFLSGGHQLEGFWMKSLVKIEQVFDSINIKVIDAEGYYAINKFGEFYEEPFEINYLQEGNEHPLKPLEKGPPILPVRLTHKDFYNYEDFSKKYGSEESNGKINSLKKFLSSSKTLYGKVPHHIFISAFKKAKISAVKGLSKESFYFLIANIREQKTELCTSENLNKIRDELILHLPPQQRYSKDIQFYPNDYMTDYTVFFNSSSYLDFSPILTYPRVRSNIIAHKILKNDILQYPKRLVDSFQIKSKGIVSTKHIPKPADIYSKPFFQINIGDIIQLTPHDFSFEYKTQENNDSIVFNGFGYFNQLQRLMDFKGDGKLIFRNKEFSGFFKSGILDSLYKVYDKTYFVESGTFKKGKKHGAILKGDMYGRIKSKFHFNNGVINKDSIHFIYDYFNLPHFINETPKSFYKLKIDEINEEAKLIEKIELDNISVETVIPTSDDSYTLNQWLYNNSSKLLMRSEGDKIWKYAADIIQQNGRSSIKFKTYEYYSKDNEEHYKSEADPRTGNPKPGGRILIWKDKDGDYVANNKNGDYRSFYIDHAGVFQARGKDGVWNHFWDGVNSSFKAIADFLGVDGWSFEHDSEEGFSFTVEKEGKTVSLNLKEVYDHYNQPNFDNSYFEAYREALIQEEIAGLPLDTYQKVPNRTIAGSTAKVKVKYFKPKLGVPYFWGAIIPPTISQTIRKDPEGVGTLAARRGGGSRSHAGVDYEAQPGEMIISPISGTIVHNPSYADGTKEEEKKYYDSNVQCVRIQTDDGTIVKLAYLTADKRIKKGLRVEKGEKIGVMPDMRWRHLGNLEKRPIRKYNEGMKNHIHMEILLPDKTLTDRARFLSIEKF